MSIDRRAVRESGCGATGSVAEISGVDNPGVMGRWFGGHGCGWTGRDRVMEGSSVISGVDNPGAIGRRRVVLRSPRAWTVRTLFRWQRAVIR